MKRILFVMMEARFSKVFAGSLYEASSLGYAVCSRQRSRLACILSRQLHVVISDMRMPEMDGAALLDFIRDHYPNTMRTFFPYIPKIQWQDTRFSSRAAS